MEKPFMKESTNAADFIVLFSEIASVTPNLQQLYHPDQLTAINIKVRPPPAKRSWRVEGSVDS